MAIELKESLRYDIIKLLKEPSGNIGVELGVAAGGFSEKMMNSGLFKSFIGVDRYSDVHGIDEYKTALTRVGIWNSYKILRMTFDEAYDLFEDESLDFIYVDGYAHTGEEGGQTIYKWAKKVKIGGVIAGDDYHPNWPLVMEAVNSFVKDTGFELHVTTISQPGVDYSEYPSWGVTKDGPVLFEAPEYLVKKGKFKARQVHIKRFVRNLFS